MTRRHRPLPIALLAVVPLAACAGEARDPAGDEASLMERAREIHERVITIDTHVDIRASNFTPEQNYTVNLPGTQVDLPSMEEGGLDVAWLIVYTGQGDLDPEGYAAAYANADEKFDAIHRLVNEFAPDRIALATSSDEVRAIQAEGKKVAMIGVENAYPIGTDLSRIEAFHARGARYISLAHNGHSQFSDSNTGERDGEWLHGDGVTTGLSDLGRAALAEMNRVGIMVDVSHPSKGAFMEMARLSEAPLMASHSSARALNDHSRNLDDEQLRLLAESGGVVQTVAFRSYLDGEKHAANVEARRALGDENADPGEAAPPVDVADFVDHIDYLVDLIGIDHVGISSDFDGGGGVQGWDDASETFNVTLELVRRGYTEEEIAKLWGGNLLRVLDETQAVAARLQAEAAQR
ncbi:MAG: dipeptidase [Longimicrobiales bacterium]|nr:dipeptidase [Longimicrobiales bacterium]